MRTTSSIAENGASGTTASGSASANSPTVVAIPLTLRRRASNAAASRSTPDYRLLQHALTLPRRGGQTTAVAP